MAQVISTNGAINEIQPQNGKFFELEELQNVVGGYIEIVRLGNEKLMVVNEEGKLEQLPWNIIATSIYQRCTRALDYIAGNAFICNSNEIN